MSLFSFLKKHRIGLGWYLSLGPLLIFSLAAVFLIHQVNENARQQALREAEAKAQLILDHNLAIHTYFSHQLKPTVFELTDQYRASSYFEPSWMSSTYAVREIVKEAKRLNQENYYYKECAINARSPQNEADDFERAFIQEASADPSLQYRSLIREIDGAFYYVTLRKGEVLEASCLRCHSTADQAPSGLVDAYGPERSFHRSQGELVSAISIRVPLSSAYARAAAFTRQLSLILLLTLLAVFVVQYLIHRYLILRPIEGLRRTTGQISDQEDSLGAQVALPVSRELADLAATFNRMSGKLRQQVDTLEESVARRTSELSAANHELRLALDEIRTLQGILPVCSYCKKIRDDSGTERGKGRWMRMEEYINRKTGMDVSHGCCPECLARHIDDLGVGPGLTPPDGRS